MTDSEPDFQFYILEVDYSLALLFFLRFSLQKSGPKLSTNKMRRNATKTSTSTNTQTIKKEAACTEDNVGSISGASKSSRAKVQRDDIRFDGTARKHVRAASLSVYRSNDEANGGWLSDEQNTTEDCKLGRVAPAAKRGDRADNIAAGRKTTNEATTSCHVGKSRLPVTNSSVAAEHTSVLKCRADEPDFQKDSSPRRLNKTTVSESRSSMDCTAGIASGQQSEELRSTKREQRKRHLRHSRLCISSKRSCKPHELLEEVSSDDRSSSRTPSDCRVRFEDCKSVGHEGHQSNGNHRRERSAVTVKTGGRVDVEPASTDSDDERIAGRRRDGGGEQGECSRAARERSSDGGRRGRRKRLASLLDSDSERDCEVVEPGNDTQPPPTRPSPARPSPARPLHIDTPFGDLPKADRSNVGQSHAGSAREHSSNTSLSEAGPSHEDHSPTAGTGSCTSRARRDSHGRRTDGASTKSRQHRRSSMKTIEKFFEKSRQRMHTAAAEDSDVVIVPDDRVGMSEDIFTDCFIREELCRPATAADDDPLVAALKTAK